MIKNHLANDCLTKETTDLLAKSQFSSAKRTKKLLLPSLVQFHDLFILFMYANWQDRHFENISKV